LVDYKFPVTVYFSDTDCGGIVYHGSYINFAEHARSEMFSQFFSLDTLLKDKISFVVKKLEVSYELPAHLGEHLEVVTTINSVKRFSTVYHQRVMRGETLLTDILVKVACINPETGHIQAIPEFVKASFKKFEEEN